MASATPRDFVRTSHGFEPRAKPPKPGGGGGVTGATWTKNGPVDQRTGKVYFSMDGGNWQCSGSVASDSRSSFSLVLTAGHCAYDETNGNGQQSGFATNWMFIPNWGDDPATFSTACDAGATSFGCWTAAALVVHGGFATAGGFNTQATIHDFAFAVVGPGGYGNADLVTTVGGGYALTTSGISTGTKMYAFGYPAAGKYHGNVLTYCAGNISQDASNSNLTWGLPCDMTGGSSGGEWLAGFNENTGIGSLGSLNSYGYSGVRNMYGPKFNSNTQAVYNSANSNGTTSNTIVP